MGCVPSFVVLATASCGGCASPAGPDFGEAVALDVRHQTLAVATSGDEVAFSARRHATWSANANRAPRRSTRSPRLDVALPRRFTRIVAWNVQGRFDDSSRTAATRWDADVVLLNDQRRSEDHDDWLTERTSSFDWFGYDYSIASFGPRLELMEPLTHPEYRAPIVHLRWQVAQDEFHLFALHAQTPLGTPERHWKFLREADLIVDAIGSVTGHVRTIIAGDFNSRSPLDGETEYIHSVTRLLNAGYVDTYSAANPGEFEATKLHGNNAGHRIDYVFVSDDLRPAVVRAGVDTRPTYPENSDHLPVWADLDFSRLAASGT